MTLMPRFKPDAQATFDRFEAWWHREVIDRPPVTCYVRSQRPYRGPTSTHADFRARWLDVSFNVEAAIARMQQTDYVADAIPVYMPNVGPEVMAALYGCDLIFSESTSWSTPIVHDAGQWPDILQRQPNYEDVYWQTIERMTDLAIEQCDGRYIVGITDLHGSYDILAALRDPQALCMDMLDAPELVFDAGLHTARGFVAAFERLWQRVAAAGMGSTTWTPVYHQGPAYLPNCDLWCMVSPALARRMILPTLEIELQPLARSLFPLGRPQALRRLALLLELPNLDGVRWVYGAGAGPAARWIDVYRRIRDAGKCMQVIAEDADDALAVLDAVGPQGVWVTVSRTFDDPQQVQAFLENVQQHACSRRP